MDIGESKSHPLNLEEYLNLILANCQFFICDDNIVYKSCSDQWMVVMKKLDDTITNESRKSVVDVAHAKFRANKLLVLKIFNKFDCDKTREIIDSNYEGKITTYKVGEVVYPDYFYSDVEKTCSYGIHYYKTVEPAFYHDMDYIHYGTRKSWYENGEKHTLITRENDGMTTYTSWFPDGNIWIC